MKLIFCFGDSLTRGSWDSQGGWCGRLRQEIDKKFIETDDPKYFQNLFNLGVSSRPLEDILARFDNETKARTRNGAENIFVFMVGMVNASQDATTKQNATSDEEYLALLEQLVQNAKKYGDKMLFVGLPPVDEARVNEPRRVERLGKVYFNKRVAEIDALTTKFCEQQGIPKVEIFEEMSAMDYPSMIFDGIHPNDEGHKWIYQKVREPFLKLAELE